MRKMRRWFETDAAESLPLRPLTAINSRPAKASCVSLSDCCQPRTLPCKPLLPYEVQPWGEKTRSAFPGRQYLHRALSPPHRLPTVRHDGHGLAIAQNEGCLVCTAPRRAPSRLASPRRMRPSTPSNVTSLVRLCTHAVGQFRTFKVREIRGANAGSESAADENRNPPVATKSRKRSLNESKYLAALKLGRVANPQRLELARPIPFIHPRPWTDRPETDARQRCSGLAGPKSFLAISSVCATEISSTDPNLVPPSSSVPATWK